MPLTTYVAGDVLTAASLNDNFTFAAANPTAPAVAIFNETQASGTSGGIGVTGSFQKRVLNTTVVNQITGCTLTSSVIALPAGTYSVNGFQASQNQGPFIGRLQNTTDTVTVARGPNVNNNGADVTLTQMVQGVFTIAAAKNFELQYRSTNAGGLGVAASFAGVDEVYATIEIVKLA